MSAMPVREALPLSLAEQIRQRRQSMGLTQYQLAEVTGLTRSKIKRIEKGEVNSVSGEDFKRLAQLLGSFEPEAKPVAEAPSWVEEEDLIRQEVNRRVRESILTVIREIIGDYGHVLVRKYGLHDVTLGELYQVERSDEDANHLAEKDEQQ